MKPTFILEERMDCYIVYVDCNDGKGEQRLMTSTSKRRAEVAIDELVDSKKYDPHAMSYDIITRKK